MKSFYTISDVAAILHICERTTYEYIYQGKLRAAKIGGKWIIKEEWIDEFVNANEAKVVNCEDNKELL